MKAFKPPSGARAAACRALKWLKEVKAGTPVGWARARDLCNGRSLSMDTISRVHRFFSRHQQYRSTKYELVDGKPTPWRVAWDLWGGDAMRRFAESVMRREGRIKSLQTEDVFDEKELEPQEVDESDVAECGCEDAFAEDEGMYNVVRARKYRPPHSVEPSFLTDRHEIHYLLEHMAKSMRDMGSGHDYAWFGAPTNNVQDNEDDVLPEACIMRDIAFQSFAIEKNLLRPTSGGDPDRALFDDIIRLNGPTFKDYGALLLEHDMNRKVGVAVSRLMVKGGNVCFEFGMCDSKAAEEYINMPIERRVRMSHGFLGLRNGNEFVAVHTYERSALKKLTPANPMTFWMARRVDLTTDDKLAQFLDELEGLTKPQN